MVTPRLHAMKIMSMVCERNASTFVMADLPVLHLTVHSLHLLQLAWQKQ